MGEVQASLRDAGRELRLFRGLKRHGYRREVALRLRGGGFRSGRAGRSGEIFGVGAFYQDACLWS